MKQITYACDRCGKQVTASNDPSLIVRPLNVKLVVAAVPKVERKDLELCFACGETLAALHRTFLEGA